MTKAELMKTIGLKNYSALTSLGLDFSSIEPVNETGPCELEDADAIAITIYPADAEGNPLNDSSRTISYNFGYFTIGDKEVKVNEGVHAELRKLFPEGALDRNQKPMIKDKGSIENDIHR